MKPKWWNKAKKQLRQRDKVMKKLLSAYIFRQNNSVRFKHFQPKQREFLRFRQSAQITFACI